MRQTRIELNTEADPIDGVMCGPEKIKPPIPAVVVCHAHPLLGGTVDHPVVIAICRELADRGIASLRFSFRVGMRDNEALNASAARDVALAVEAIRMWNFVNPRRVAAAGHSFGASAILRALPNLGDAKAVSLLAPPVNSLAASNVEKFNLPRQLLVGTKDKMVNPDALRVAARKKDPGINFDTVENADHNFNFTYNEAATLSAAFLAVYLLP